MTLTRTWTWKEDAQRKYWEEAIREDLRDWEIEMRYVVQNQGNQSLTLILKWDLIDWYNKTHYLVESSVDFWTWVLIKANRNLAL